MHLSSSWRQGLKACAPVFSLPVAKQFLLHTVNRPYQNKEGLNTGLLTAPGLESEPGPSVTKEVGIS